MWYTPPLYHEINTAFKVSETEEVVKAANFDYLQFSIVFVIKIPQKLHHWNRYDEPNALLEMYNDKIKNK